MFVNACHARGVRLFLDVVLGFMKEEPYRYIDFDSFYLEDPKKHPDDPDARIGEAGRADCPCHRPCLW